MRGRDELTVLPEASSASGIGGQQAHYYIKQHRAIEEEKNDKEGVWGLVQKNLHTIPDIKLENTLLQHGVTVAIIINLCIQMEN